MFLCLQCPGFFPHFSVLISSPIPLDIWKEVFLSLNPTEIANISQVCKSFHSFVNSRNFIEKIVLPLAGKAIDWSNTSKAIQYFKLASYFNKFKDFVHWYFSRFFENNCKGNVPNAIKVHVKIFILVQ